MTAQRLPYDHTLSEINDVNQALNTITDGRGVPDNIAVGVLTIRSNLAIASSLLAVADAIRAIAAGQTDGNNR
jgi:acetyl-CoA acetyltransferase